MHSFNLAAASDQTVLIACRQYFTILGAQKQLRLVDWTTNDGQSQVFDLNGLTDVIVRVQHFIPTATTVFELWSTDGKVYGVKRMAGRGAPTTCESDIKFGANGSGGYLKGSLAYYRWFDTTVAEGMAPSTSPAGALLAYEFETNAGTGTTVARTLAMSGGAKFGNSPAFPPVVKTFPNDTTAEVGQTVQLDGSGTLAGAPITTWNWKVASGPSPATLTGQTTATPKLSGLTKFGTYVLNATATDALGATGTSQVRIGVVDVNALGVVKIADPNVSFAVGPLLRSGLEPWPFYDSLRSTFGRKWGNAYPDGPPGENDNRAGQIALTTNSTTVTGTGTQFINDFMETPTTLPGTVTVAAGATTVTGVGTNFTDTFLTNRQPALGVITLFPDSFNVTGLMTQFLSTVSPGDYLVVPMGASTVAMRVAKVIDNGRLQLERIWTGDQLIAASFLTAKDAGLMLMIQDPNGKRWLSEPIVTSNTEVGLRTAYAGAAGTFLKISSTKVSTYGNLIAHYPISKGVVGRAQLSVAGVTSDTSLILRQPYTGTSYLSSKYGRASQEELFAWQEGINYYDSVLAQYQNYYRTGNDEYRTYARDLADAWFITFDSGRDPSDSPYPARSMSLTGLMLRAMDGRPEMWPMIRRAVNYNYNLWIGMRMNYPGLYYGVREGGYSLYYTAMLGAIDPDLVQRAKYKTMARDAAVNLYARLQQADGSWRWEDSAWQGLGEQPFHDGLLLEGLIATHRITGDPTVLQAIMKSVDHIIAVQQPAPCRGPVYALYVTGGDWGHPCVVPNMIVDGGTIRDIRAGNNTILHAVGYVYALTGQSRYKSAGDDMFGATFGNMQGPFADAYWGRADQDMKQYGQSFRTSGSYVAYRTLGVTDLSR